MWGRRMEEGGSSIFKQNIDTGQNCYPLSKASETRPLAEWVMGLEQTHLPRPLVPMWEPKCGPSLHSELCFALPLTSPSVLLGPSHLMDWLTSSMGKETSPYPRPWTQLEEAVKVIECESQLPWRKVMGRKELHLERRQSQDHKMNKARHWESHLSSTLTSSRPRKRPGNHWISENCQNVSHLQSRILQSKIPNLGTGTITRRVKCLWSKHKHPNLIPRTHVKMPGVVVDSQC